jgi:aryl-phospho-beta-D-glucosidase BglC (GH1 family)
MFPFYALSVPPAALPPPVTPDTSWISGFRTGVNLVGMEEPTWHSGYTHPPHGQGLIDYLSSKNVAVVRLLFAWESIQPVAFGPIPGGGAATTYFNNFKSVLNKLLAKGMYVYIAHWQYGDASGDTDMTYYGESFTASMFADLWGKLAAHFSYSDKIAFGLINEPHTGGGVGITLNNWFADAQAAINAIRTAGSSNYILVPGMGYASAGSWVSNGSAAKFIALTDTFSPKRLIAECHNYGDNYGGPIAGRNLTTHIQPMVTHARANGYKIFVGEIARSSNPVTNPATAADVSEWANWVNYCVPNSDVIIGWAWWAVDDNSFASWGTNHTHWSLVKAGTNNQDSQWMNLIESSLG